MADDGGIGRLRRRLAEMRTNINEATQPALQKQATAMAETMRQLAPEDTGDLRDSIEVTPGGKVTPPYSQPGGMMTVPENAVAITVGNEDVRYPHLQEYGTRKMQANPFFWPSVRLHDKKSRQAIKRSIGAAVRKNWGKP